MASAEQFGEVVSALMAVLPADVDVVGVELTNGSDTVTLWTSTPRQAIGRRGSLSAETERKLTERLGRKVNLRYELPDGVVDGEQTTEWQISLYPGPSRPRIWRRIKTAEELRGSVVPPEWD